MFLMGCGPADQIMTDYNKHMPPNSTDVKKINEYWVSFKYNGKEYLCTSRDNLVIVPIGDNESTPKTSLTDKFRCPKCGATIVLTELGPVHVQPVVPVPGRGI